MLCFKYKLGRPLAGRAQSVIMKVTQLARGGIRVIPRAGSAARSEKATCSVGPERDCRFRVAARGSAGRYLPSLPGSAPCAVTGLTSPPVPPSSPLKLSLSAPWLKYLWNITLIINYNGLQ